MDRCDDANALLVIGSEEVLHFTHSVGELFTVGEVDDAEMVGLFPMESAAVSEQDLLFSEKIQNELLVVFKPELVLIKSGEDIKRSLRSYSGHSVDVVYKLADALSLFVDPSAGEKHLIDDEINVLLTDIRKKIGEEGAMLVVVDACHSGDSSRGEDIGETVPRAAW